MHSRQFRCCKSCWHQGWALHHHNEQCKLSMQVVVLVLAALSMFTLWGAVLVDVGTALLVILHGMMLMRWRLLQAMTPGSGPNVQCSQQRWSSSTPSPLVVGNQDDFLGNMPCCSSNDSCETSAVKDGDSTVVLPPGRNPNCCSADRECSKKAAIVKPEAGSAADRPICCSSGKLCKPKAVVKCGKGIPGAAASRPSCRNSGQDRQDKASAVKPEEHTGTCHLPNGCSFGGECIDRSITVKPKEQIVADCFASGPTCCDSGKICQPQVTACKPEADNATNAFAG